MQPKRRLPHTHAVPAGGGYERQRGHWAVQHHLLLVELGVRLPLLMLRVALLVCCLLLSTKQELVILQNLVQHSHQYRLQLGTRSARLISITMLRRLRQHVLLLALQAWHMLQHRYLRIHLSLRL
jgi:hypothetical protein